MTTSALILMLLSWTAISILMSWCMYRLVNKQP
jgi:hypothetical protein